MYAPLFRKHRALPANPSLALNKKTLKAASAAFLFGKRFVDGSISSLTRLCF